MRKKLLFAIIGLLIYLAGCTTNPTVEQTGILSERDLNGCALYVHNVTCSEVSTRRTVSDSDYIKKIVELSITAEYFRPVISVDILLGAEPDAYYVFDNGKEKYTFSFFDVEKQLDIGFEYREKPILAVGKTTTADSAQSQEDWVWMCTMSAANYAELFEMIQTYTGGDILM